MFRQSAAAVVFGVFFCFWGMPSHLSAQVDDDAMEEQPTEPKPAAHKHASPKQIDELVQRLGDRRRSVRQAAQEELADLGYEAVESLRAAAQGKDEVLAARARYVLRLIHVDWVLERDPPEVRRCLREYEAMTPDTRLDVMHRLAKLPDAKGVPALCRLVRYESDALGKQAAMAIFFDDKDLRFPNATTAAVIRADLQDCRRTAAQWVLMWLRLAEKPQEAPTELAKLVDGEIDLLKKSPSDTSLQLTVDLIAFETTWLHKIDQKKAASAAASRFAELDYPKTDAEVDDDALARVVVWLIGRKEWAAFDAVAKRQADRFAADPVLLYLEAQSLADRGRQTEADKIAMQAFQLKPKHEETETRIARRFGIAVLLRNSGQYAWAQREFERLLTDKRPQIEGIVRLNLADMLHEQEKDIEAAGVVEPIAKAVESKKPPQDILQLGDPRSFCAKRYYYLACAAKAKKDAAKQREYLDKAIEFDPNDIDLLIECYQLKRQPANYHKKIIERVQALAAQLKKVLSDDDASAGDFNNYAWLIANTEGDLDDALRCSQKSLEMSPREAGYFDTLAQVYFARGELKEAVRTQTKALELEARSVALQRHLDVFRKALEKKAEKKNTDRRKSGTP